MYSVDVARVQIYWTIVASVAYRVTYPQGGYLYFRQLRYASSECPDSSIMCNRVCGIVDLATCVLFGVIVPFFPSHMATLGTPANAGRGVGDVANATAQEPGSRL